MSYCIRYETKKHPWQKRRDHRKIIIAIGCFCMILLLIGYLGIGKVQDFLPGDPNVTAQALENMTESLSSGERLRDAIVTFCQEILDHGASAQ